MIATRRQGRLGAWWQWVVRNWNRTPGYLKWLGGLLLGAVLREVFERLFPEWWGRISHTLLDPQMPIWMAVVAVIVVLILEHAGLSVYQRLRARREEAQLYSLFGVQWAVPPQVEHVQGPYCTKCAVPLRGTLWSGDSSPTLWVCPSCSREFSTPEFPDIRREVENRVTAGGSPVA